MSQEGSLGNQSTDVSIDSRSAPMVTDSGTLSSGENRNGGSWTGVPAAEDASSKRHDVEVELQLGSAASSRSGAAGRSKGKSLAVEVATDDTADNMSNKAGKSKAAASRGGRRKQLPHIVTERERRRKMKDMFAEMQSLLPHVPKKTDKATIVDEAINFIKVLEGTVAKLEKKKQELALKRRADAFAMDLNAPSSSAAPPNAAQRPLALPQGFAWLPKKEQKPAAAPPPPVGFQTWSGKTKVVVSVSMDDAYITVCVPRRPGVLTMVLSVLEKHRLDVITMQVASDNQKSMFNIHARVNKAAILQLGIELPVSEDIYKLAVSEIMIRLSNN